MYQKIVILGNLGSDPDMRFTPDGQAVCNMSVATNNTYNNSKGELVKETTWWRVAVWGKQAEACHKYLSKGRQVLVEGRLQPDENGNPRTYESNGETRASYELRANSVKFIGAKDDAKPAAEESPF